MIRRPTITEIARRLGVSPSTVSRALRDHPGISEERKREVRAAATAAGRAPRSTAARTGLVACIVPSISHPFFAEVLERLAEACSRGGHELVVHTTASSPANESAIVKSLTDRRVDGVLFVPSSAGSMALAECAERLRTVVITQQTPLCPCIGVSHEDGGRLVAEHFMELGRTSCLLVGPSSDAKFSGFRSFIESRRLTGFRVDTAVMEGWNESAAIGARAAILERFDAAAIRDFDCIFGFNDLAAMGAMHAVADLGPRIPGDIAVCGFDDIPLAREILPGLTSVAQPVGQIVRTGLALLERLIRGEHIPESDRSIVLKPHLVVRSSTYAGA